jgi:hypothetical protein
MKSRIFILSWAIRNRKPIGYWYYSYFREYYSYFPTYWCCSNWYCSYYCVAPIGFAPIRLLLLLLLPPMAWKHLSNIPMHILVCLWIWLRIWGRCALNKAMRAKWENRQEENNWIILPCITNHKLTIKIFNTWLLQRLVQFATQFFLYVFIETVTLMSRSPSRYNS